MKKFLFIAVLGLAAHTPTMCLASDNTEQNKIEQSALEQDEPNLFSAELAEEGQNKPNAVVQIAAIAVTAIVISVAAYFKFFKSVVRPVAAEPVDERNPVLDREVDSNGPQNEVQVDDKPAIPRPATCDTCNEGLAPRAYCATCEQFFCGSCNTIHSRHRATNSHVAMLLCDICSNFARIHCVQCDQGLCFEDHRRHNNTRATKLHTYRSAVKPTGATNLREHPEVVAVVRTPSSFACAACADVAKHYCVECEQYFCAEDIARHMRSTVMKNHNILSVALD